MKYIEGIDYWVRYREFPCTTIFAWAVSLGDGTFDIWLNTRVSEKKQLEGLRHDLKHLEDNHFFRDDLTLAQKEAIAWGATGFSKPETKEPEKPELPKQAPAIATPVPPLPQQSEITTIGQLLKTVVGWEKGKRNPSYKSNAGKVSVDIMGE